MLAAITSPSPRRTGLNTAHVIIMLSARIRIARTIPLITSLKVNPKKPANYCSPKCVNDLRYAGMGTRKTRALPGRGRRVSSKNAVTCCREHAVALRKLSEAHKEAMSPEQAKDEGTGPPLKHARSLTAASNLFQIGRQLSTAAMITTRLARYAVSK